MKVLPVVVLFFAIIVGSQCQFYFNPYPFYGPALYDNSAMFAARTWAFPEAFKSSGQYVAKTRGAEHVAPLQGHLKSVAWMNTDPAPRTQ